MWLLLTLALALRLPGAVWWWFNPDESIYHRVATAGSEHAGRVIASNAHPPLFYWVLRACALVSDDPFVLRLPSLVCGVALVAVVARLSTRWFDARAGTWAGAWIALGPASVLMSQVMRPYAALALMLALAALGVSDWLQTRSPRGLVVYSLGLVVALGLHYSAFLFVGGCLAGLLVLALARRLEPRAWLALAAAHVPPLAAMAWLYLGHIAPRLRGSALEAEAHEGWLEPHFVRGPLEALEQLGGAFELAIGEAAALLAVLLLLGGWFARRSKRDEAWLLPSGVLACGLVASWLGLYPLGGIRHAYHLVPLLVALAAGSVPAATALAPGRVRSIAHTLPWIASAFLVVASGSLVLRNRPKVMQVEHVVRRSEASEFRAALRERIDARAVLLADHQTINLLTPLLGAREDWFRRRKGTALVRMPLEGRTVFALDQGQGERIAVAWNLSWLPGRGPDEPALATLVRALLDDARLAERAARHGLWFVHSATAPESLEDLAVGAPGSAFLELEGGPGLGALRIDPQRYLELVAPSAPR